MFRGSKSRRQPLVLKRAARRGGRPVFFSAFKQCSTTIQKSIIHRKSLHNSMIERRQKNQAYSCGLLGLTPPCHLSAAATPHARRAHPSAKNCRFCFGRLHFIPAACAERPRLRYVQSLRFLPLPIVTFSVLPHFWFLSNCLLSTPSHCRGISSMSAVSQREPSASIKLKPLRTDSIVFFFLWFTASIDGLGSKAKASAPFSTPFRGSGIRFPKGTLGIQTASLRASIAQAFAHNVPSPPSHPF